MDRASEKKVNIELLLFELFFGIVGKFFFLFELIISDLDNELKDKVFSMGGPTLQDECTNKPEEYSKNDSLFKNYITQDYFQSFIENKIFKHPIIINLLSNEEGSSIYKECYTQTNGVLEKKLSAAVFIFLRKITGKMTILYLN